MNGKSRKRSISSILDEESFSNRRFTMSSRRNRSISIIEEESTPSRQSVRYYCIECNGKFIDSRTKIIHESRNQGSQASILTTFCELDIQEESKSEDNFEEYEQQSEDNFEEYEQQSGEVSTSALVTEDDFDQGYGQYEEVSTSALAVRRIIEPQISNDDEYQEDSEFTFLPRQCLRRYKNCPKSDTNFPDDDPRINDDEPSESSKSSEFTTEEDDNSHDSQSGNETSNGEESETFEDYSPPDYEPSQDPPGIGSMIDGRFLWILL